MKRPAAYMLLSLIVGILTAYLTDAGSDFIAVPVFSLVVLLTYILAKQTRFRITYIFPLFCIIGCVLTDVKLRPVSAFLDEHVSGSEPETVIVEGTVENVESQYGGLRIIVNIRQTDIGYAIVSTSYKIITDTVYNMEIEAGDTARISGILKKPEKQMFTGESNNYLYLKSRKLEYTMQVRKIQIVPASFSVKAKLYSLRDNIGKVFYNTLPHSEAGLMKAMITGDYSSLDSELKELYRVAGIYHVIVISGAHLSIMCLAVRGLLMLARLGKGVSGVIALSFLMFYCVMTGSGASSVRALIMSAVMVLGDLLHRRTETLASLSIAGIVLLIYEPFYIFDAGFLYSFSAVLGIGCLSVPLKNMFTLLSERSKAVRAVFSQEYIAKYLPAVCGAYFATLPVCAFFFGTFPLYGIIGNIIVAGSSSVIVILGFLTGLAGLVYVPAASFLSGTVYVLLSFYEYICRSIVNLPYSQIQISRNIVPILLYIALWAVISYVFSTNRLRRLNKLVK